MMASSCNCQELFAKSYWQLRSGPLPYGFFAGILWGLGNAGLSFALSSGVEFPIAVSIYNCSLFVGGLWGILIFKEIRGVRGKGLFFASACALFAGIALEATLFH